MNTKSNHKDSRPPLGYREAMSDTLSRERCYFEDKMNI